MEKIHDNFIESLDQLPKSWLGYFDKPYPEEIDWWIKNDTIDKEKLGIILNGVVEHLINFRNNPKMVKLLNNFQQFRKIVEKYKTLKFKIKIDDSLDEIFIEKEPNLDSLEIKPEGFIYLHSKDNKKIVDFYESFMWNCDSLSVELLDDYARSLLCVYFPETRESLSKRKDSEIEQKNFISRFLRLILKQRKKDFHGYNYYDPFIFSVPAGWLGVGNWRGESNSSFHPKHYYSVLQDFERFNNKDIVVGAPRSAIFSEQVLKGALDYLSIVDPERFTETHFSFPKSKSFLRLSKESNWAKKSPNYLEEFLLRIKENRTSDDVVEKNLVKDIRNYADLIKKQYVKKGRKISIFVYDESINFGYTIDALEKLVLLSVKLAEYELDTENIAEIFGISAIDSKGNYGGWPKYMKTSRKEGGRGDRYNTTDIFVPYSVKDESPEHFIGSFSLLVGYLTGQHIGFLYDKSKKLDELNFGKRKI